MKLPNELKINIDLKLFLKQQKINEIQMKLDKKAYRQVIKFCRKMAKLGYEFDLVIDDTMLCYRNGELIENEKKSIS